MLRFNTVLLNKVVLCLLWWTAHFKLGPSLTTTVEKELLHFDWILYKHKQTVQHHQMLWQQPDTYWRARSRPLAPSLGRTGLLIGPHAVSAFHPFRDWFLRFWPVTTIHIPLDVAAVGETERDHKDPSTFFKPYNWCKLAYNTFYILHLLREISILSDRCKMCSATSYTNLAVNGTINACINLFPSSLDLMHSEHFQRYSGSSLEKEKCIGKDIKKQHLKTF